MPVIMLDSCSPLAYVDPSIADVIYLKMQPSVREVESKSLISLNLSLHHPNYGINMLCMTSFL